MLKRLFDIILSLAGIILLFPFLVIIAMVILAGSPGGVFYLQKRVGKNNIDFHIIKFRTMYKGSDKQGLLTVGKDDPRVTPEGRWLRRYKLDELPQLFNILAGEMSFVGPRPEVRKYVNLYTDEQKRALSVRPGLTDYASLRFANENEVLDGYPNPEKAYIEEILPEKLKLNLHYIDTKSFMSDLRILCGTAKRIILTYRKT